MTDKPKSKTDRRGAPKGVRGQPAHVVTDANKAVVETHAAVGTPHETIAFLLGISADTLTRHYREQLDHGLAKANATIGGQMFSMATGKRVNPVTNAVEAIDPAVQFRAAQFWQDRRGGPAWRARQQHDVGFGMGSGDAEQPQPDEVTPAKITIEFVGRKPEAE